ncbi:hypothetical protein K7432_018634 [Basidiobolus ranarum]|uniref:Uncharacterized protein n=1 Tax=Basidiobolus ranarum TaxID=34480 RepID=A0ABR2W8L0_9FUNG
MLLHLSHHHWKIALRRSVKIEGNTQPYVITTVQFWCIYSYFTLLSHFFTATVLVRNTAEVTDICLFIKDITSIINDRTQNGIFIEGIN